MSAAPVSGNAMPFAMPAVAAGAALGLFPAATFRVTDGHGAAGAAIPQALWYFRSETIAVPVAGLPVASFAMGVPFDDDLRTWLATWRVDGPPDYPPLVWTAAPAVFTGARISSDASTLTTSSGEFAFRLTAKIALNRSYFDPTSARFFAGRRVKVRGMIDGTAVIARTLWPEDWRLADLQPPLPAPADAPATALRHRMRADPQGGATSPFCAETLWQRAGENPNLRGGAVIGFMVNGAQGDDDEAHGGHFALVTGRVQDDGAIGDWLASNFYTLDAESEKGIIAATVPLDNYLADLNAGQSWYRPSYLLVAVLAKPRAAALLQSALGRVFNQFYRHQLVYYHPSMNCTSISIDVLRALGWAVPARGPTQRLLAWAGFPLFALKERSIAKARIAFDYLYEDQTRLLPAAALEEIYGSLLGLTERSGPESAARGTLAAMLAQDLDALVWLQFPQLPSSRDWGDAPAATTWEYRTRIPADPAMVKIVPVPPRPFPAAMRDPDLLPQREPLSARAAALWGIVSIVGIPWVLAAAWRRWRRARSSARVTKDGCGTAVR